MRNKKITASCDCSPESHIADIRAHLEKLDAFSAFISFLCLLVSLGAMMCFTVGIVFISKGSFWPLQILFYMLILASLKPVLCYFGNVSIKKDAKVSRGFSVKVFYRQLDKLMRSKFNDLDASNMKLILDSPEGHYDTLPWFKSRFGEKETEAIILLMPNFEGSVNELLKVSKEITN